MAHRHLWIRLAAVAALAILFGDRASAQVAPVAGTVNNTSTAQVGQINAKATVTANNPGYIVGSVVFELGDMVNGKYVSRSVSMQGTKNLAGVYVAQFGAPAGQPNSLPPQVVVVRAYAFFTGNPPGTPANLNRAPYADNIVTVR